MSLIYALVAKSNPSEIRYIGKTANATPAKRLSKHLYEAKTLDKQTYKCRWIRKVLNERDEVVALTIESNLTNEQALEQEIFLIDYYRSLGYPLTNITGGGEGLLGHIHTQESKDKMSLAQTGKRMSQEAKEKISLAMMGNTRTLGYKHTDESKAKMSSAGKVKIFTQEHKANISATKKKKNKEAKAARTTENLGAEYEPSNT